MEKDDGALFTWGGRSRCNETAEMGDNEVTV